MANPKKCIHILTSLLTILGKGECAFDTVYVFRQILGLALTR